PQRLTAKIGPQPDRRRGNERTVLFAFFASDAEFDETTTPRFPSRLTTAGVTNSADSRLTTPIARRIWNARTPSWRDFWRMRSGACRGNDWVTAAVDAVRYRSEGGTTRP